jgi:hypothetical protein
MFKGMLDKAKDLKDKADMSLTLEDSKNAANTTLDAGRNKASEAFETHWPKVEAFVLEGALPLATEKLADDGVLRSLFEKAYALLPIPLRLILPKATFVEMGMSRRDPLLRRLQDLRARSQP